jgi:hypothetical protein
MAAARGPGTRGPIKSISQNMFIDRVKELYGDLYDYSKVLYINRLYPVSFTCPKHGKFTTRPVDLYNGITCRECKECKNCGVCKECREWVNKYTRS